MTKIEELELRVARLEADVRFLKTQAWGRIPPNHSETENPCSEIILTQPEEYSLPVESTYREEQQRWRDAGWDAYNCDMVDEFPTW